MTKLTRRAFAASSAAAAAAAGFVKYMDDGDKKMGETMKAAGLAKSA